jgi:hypothetical protein
MPNAGQVFTSAAMTTLAAMAIFANLSLVLPLLPALFTGELPSIGDLLSGLGGMAVVAVLSLLAGYCSPGQRQLR